jgi:hypothetical protein
MILNSVEPHKAGARDKVEDASSHINPRHIRQNTNLHDTLTASNPPLGQQNPLICPDHYMMLRRVVGSTSLIQDLGFVSSKTCFLTPYKVAISVRARRWSQRLTPFPGLPIMLMTNGLRTTRLSLREVALALADQVQSTSVRVRYHSAEASQEEIGGQEPRDASQHSTPAQGVEWEQQGIPVVVETLGVRELQGEDLVGEGGAWAASCRRLAGYVNVKLGQIFFVTSQKV